MLQEAKRNVAHLTLSRVARTHLYQSPDDDLAEIVSLDQNISQSPLTTKVAATTDEAGSDSTKGILQKSKTTAGPPSAMRILSFLRTASMSQTKNLDNIVIAENAMVDQKPTRFPLKSAKTMSEFVHFIVIPRIMCHVTRHDL
jgi:hypothetical protein